MIRRRIASDTAHSWARHLRLNNAYAKLVLCMLTLYVNEEGACFAGIETLAEDTELSPDTVRKRLAWLERVGAIVRVPQWIDPNGRRNSEGRGRRTTDEIRLMIDADTDEIERLSKGDEEPTTTPQADPRCRPGAQEQGVNPVSPAVALGLPSDSYEGLNPSNCESEKKDSPLPPKGGVTADDQGIEEARKSQTFAAFEAAGGEPILHQLRTRQIWAALTPPEEALATAAWRGYHAHRRAQRKPPNSVNAHKFLQERDAWEGFAKLDAQVQATAARVEYTIRSPEGSAWIGLHVIVGIFPYGFNRDPGGKFLVPSPLPPAVMAFADLSDERGRVDKSGWYFAGLDTNQFAAWARFVHEVSGRAARIDDHNGTPGLWVPWQWPPRKDGTLSTAGPDPLPDGIEDFR